VIEARRAAATVGVILAGGEASRMGGRAKGLASVGGIRIIDRVATALRSVVGDLLIVSARPDADAWIPGVRVVRDERPGLGPLGGIVTALRATHGDVLAVGWDMPFLSPRLLAPLLRGMPDAPIVLWRCGGVLQPLCGLYRAHALPALDAALASGERRLGRIALALDAEQLTADDPTAFLNVNTPPDLARAESLARALGAPTRLVHA
jgi:molybdenum cofactor guanylyltransferase